MTQCPGHNCSCIKDSIMEELTPEGLQQAMKVIKPDDMPKHDPKSNINDVQKTVFVLYGLDCADCAAKLEKRVAGLPGVEEAEINFGASKINVRHTASVPKIIRAIKEAGYTAEPVVDDAVMATNQQLRYDPKLLLTLLSGLFLAGGMAASLFNLADRLIAGLLLAAMLSGGYFVIKNAFYSIKALSMDMNVLMSVAVIGAVAIGEWFEGATVVFLFSLGNTLQAYSMAKTRSSIRDLMKLSPREALVLRNGREIMLSVEQIAVGDIIIVKPGERIAMDGTVIKGNSQVNQAPITGESLPVEKAPGADVYAGTINQEGTLEIQVTKKIQDTTLAKIIDLVEEAQAQRAPSQQFVDIFAKYYTPSVIATAVAIATIPTLFLGQPFLPWLERALIMLVIACPCALVISTPVAIISAIGSAARRGVLIKGGAYLEGAGGLKAVAFDKTGTLTKGCPEVTDVIALPGHQKQFLLGIAVAVEHRSQHPVARAILGYAKRERIKAYQSEQFQSIPGQGAIALINGTKYYIGNTRLFMSLGTDLTGVQERLATLQRQGKTAMLVGTADQLIGIIAVADRVRPDSMIALQGLRSTGIKKLVMLTGDNTATASAIAEYLGGLEYKAELLPQEKLSTIKELQSRYGRVAMVGDGVNDTPALAAADIGIAMGGVGTDTALETADIALMADDLSNLSYTIKLGRRTLGIIKQNITFALMVKALFIAGTFLGFTNLWMAVFADTGAAMLVIANGMRLMRVREDKMAV
ncbi:Cd2+/Zn2+-exporting ATPase [Desulfallas thermosapovorans DSM 6562]|uniref:Cd(2+)-exporting ATPase n=2 Tax=Desulfallas thermosapovorans TaxID=58137 RepID=A0A5S4ZTY5_9FIRM|nr:Cd2+/Zn2+-exporting ATPase [Desulfallas thermosapovorans DSM 6562]